MIDSKLLLFTRDERLLLYEGVKFDFIYSDTEASDCTMCSLSHLCVGQSIEMMCLRAERIDSKSGYWCKRQEAKYIIQPTVDNRTEAEKAMCDLLLG